MSPTWFICSKEVVTGPFNTEQVRAKIIEQKLGAESFIWWKGQREWIAISKWEAQLDEIVRAMTETPDSRVWYIELGTSTQGPLTHSELINHVKNQASLKNVKIWAEGMATWTSIFDVPDLMEEIGISRRQNERAPLLGTVVVSRSNVDPKAIIMNAASISIAGMGASGPHEFRRGDEVSLLLKSSSLPMIMHLRGVVAYFAENNFVGIRFLKTQPEALSILLDYVKTFNHDIGAEKKVA
jgi:hypothetical protein